MAADAFMDFSTFCYIMGKLQYVVKIVDAVKTSLISFDVE